MACEVHAWSAPNTTCRYFGLVFATAVRQDDKIVRGLVVEGDHIHNLGPLNHREIGMQAGTALWLGGFLLVVMVSLPRGVRG